MKNDPSKWPETERVRVLKSRIMDAAAREKRARRAYQVAEAEARRKGDPEQAAKFAAWDAVTTAEAKVVLGTGTQDDVDAARASARTVSAQPPVTARLGKEYAVTVRERELLTAELRAARAELREKAIEYQREPATAVLRAYAGFVKALNELRASELALEVTTELAPIIAPRSLTFKGSDRVPGSGGPSWAVFSNRHTGWGALAEEVERVNAGERLILKADRLAEVERRNRWKVEQAERDAKRPPKKEPAPFPRPALTIASGLAARAQALASKLRSS